VLIYYAFLPILVIVIILRKNPLDFGLKLGNPRIWDLYVAITCLVGLPVFYFASWSTSLQEYYRIEQFNPLIYFLETAVLLFAWEFYFRGFLLFGLKEKLAEKKHDCADDSFCTPSYRKAGNRGAEHYRYRNILWLYSLSW